MCRLPSPEPRRSTLESPQDERRRAPHSLSAVRDRNGHARPGPGAALDAGSVLGLPALRPAFLDHVPAAKPPENQACRVRLVTMTPPVAFLAPRYQLDDDPDDDLDDDDDLDEDDEDDDEDDDEEDDVETWQVAEMGRSP